MPKIALLSDIHANYPALKAVTDELERENPDIWVCMGDIVGYGPHYNECLEFIRSRDIICVKGNHDGALSGEVSVDHFRDPNRRLIKKMIDEVDTDHKRWIASLPFIYKQEGDISWIAAHASPINPENWEYLNSAIKIRQVLSGLDITFCFVGHTHKPGIVSDKIGFQRLEKTQKYMINPGSVGQSRDENYQASAGILDTDTMTYKNIRIDFNIEKVIQDLEELGFSRNASEHMMGMARSRMY